MKRPRPSAVAAAWLSGAAACVGGVVAFSPSHSRLASTPKFGARRPLLHHHHGSGPRRAAVPRPTPELWSSLKEAPETADNDESQKDRKEPQQDVVLDGIVASVAAASGVNVSATFNDEVQAEPQDQAEEDPEPPVILSTGGGSGVVATLVTPAAVEAAEGIVASAEASPEDAAGEGSGVSAGTVQQQLHEVLSSPELLDPAAILDATIGTPEVTVEALSSEAEPAEAVEAVEAFEAAVAEVEALEAFDAPIEVEALEVFDTPATEAVEPNEPLVSAEEQAAIAEAKARSKEEDLELTRRAIMNHIDQVSVGTGSGIVDDEEEDEGSLADKELTQQQSKPTLTAPSVAKILRYTIPAIGIWLCSPVLSMIDTAAVGLLSGTAQQAALNPAVSVTDYGALVVAFMYTATTNLIAAAVQEDNDSADTADVADRPKTTTTLVTALKLALFVGTVFGVLLNASGELLLKMLIGNDALDPAVFYAALRYVRIRSLGMPATVVIGTAQSACLGMQDVTSPLYVLLAAAVVNFFGDVLLVPQSGMFGGAAGAAWATVASQYAALLFFARWLTTNAGERTSWLSSFWKRTFKKNEEDVAGSPEVVNVTQGIMELTGTSKAGKSRRKEFRKFLASSKLSRRVRRGAAAPAASAAMTVTTTDEAGNANGENLIRPVKESTQPKSRGFLSKSGLSLRSYLSPSSLNRPKAREFLPFVVPVTTTSVGRISGYIAMSHVASSTLGTYDMAGHQIIFSIFCCLTPFVDALSQVAQSFVPAVFEARERGRERANALRKTIANFRKVGVGFGAVLVSLVACIPLICRYFTSDPIVMERVNGAIPGVGMFLIVNGLMCAGEGMLLGQKDLKFLRNMYAVFFFTVPAYMLRLKHRALGGLQTVGIGTMWAAFSAYNVIRTSIWHLRLAQLQRRTERGVVERVGEDGTEGGDR